jgi:hypothetical protein
MRAGIGPRLLGATVGSRGPSDALRMMHSLEVGGAKPLSPQN